MLFSEQERKLQRKSRRQRINLQVEIKETNSRDMNIQVQVVNTSFSLVEENSRDRRGYRGSDLDPLS